MAEAESSSQARVQRPGSPTRTPERPRQPLPRENTLRTLTQPTGSSAQNAPVQLSWRDTPPRTVGFDMSGKRSTVPPTAITQSSPGPSSLKAQQPTVSNQSLQSALGKGKAPLGPTFTPTRQHTPFKHAIPIGRKVSYVVNITI